MIMNPPGFHCLVLTLTHLHVLWIDTNEGTEDVVFLVRLQRFIQLFLLLGVQIRLLPLQQFLQLPVQRHNNH